MTYDLPSYQVARWHARKPSKPCGECGQPLHSPEEHRFHVRFCRHEWPDDRCWCGACIEPGMCPLAQRKGD